MLVFCCGFAVLLPVLFAVLLLLGWHLLLEGVVGTAVHAGQKYIIHRFQDGAAQDSWQAACSCSCCVCFACKKMHFQAIFMLLVMAVSMMCWAMMEGAVSAVQPGS